MGRRGDSGKCIVSYFTTASLRKFTGGSWLVNSGSRGKICPLKSPRGNRSHELTDIFMLCFPITLLTDVISKIRCPLCAKHVLGAQFGALWGGAGGG